VIRCEGTPSPELLGLTSKWNETKVFSDSELAVATKSHNELYRSLGKAAYCRLNDALVERMEKVLEANK
jgi:hypothetical protein